MVESWSGMDGSRPRGAVIEIIVSVSAGLLRVCSAINHLITHERERATVRRGYIGNAAPRV